MSRVRLFFLPAATEIVRFSACAFHWLDGKSANEVSPSPNQIRGGNHLTPRRSKNGRQRGVGRPLPLCRRVSTVFSLVCTVGPAGSLDVTMHQFSLKLVKKSSCSGDFGHGVLCGHLRPSCRLLPPYRGVVVTACAHARVYVRMDVSACVCAGAHACVRV